MEALPGVAVLGGEDPPPTPRQLARALRYPDRGVVVDLSRLPHDDKIACIREALPALSVMRRRTGLPHRIAVDEAHASCTMRTRRSARFRAQRLHSGDVLRLSIAGGTARSNRGDDRDVRVESAEVDALCRRCASCTQVNRDAWRRQLGHIPVGQAVALPITDEAGASSVNSPSVSA